MSRLSLAKMETYLKIGGKKAEDIYGIIGEHMPFASVLASEAGKILLEDALVELQKYHGKVHQDIITVNSHGHTSVKNDIDWDAIKYNKSMYCAYLAIVKRWCRRIETIVGATNTINEKVEEYKDAGR